MSVFPWARGTLSMGSISGYLLEFCKLNMKILDSHSLLEKNELPSLKDVLTSYRQHLQSELYGYKIGIVGPN